MKSLTKSDVIAKCTLVRLHLYYQSDRGDVVGPTVH